MSFKERFAKDPIRRSIKKRIFDFVRPLFVANVDRNEDYNCEWCGEPVLLRDLFCSEECSVAQDRDVANHFGDVKP